MGKQFKVIEYPLILLFIMTGATFLDLFLLAEVALPVHHNGQDHMVSLSTPHQKDPIGWP
jgi:hypothetical protein